jgi:hypothetical protein
VEKAAGITTVIAVGWRKIRSKFLRRLAALIAVAVALAAVQAVRSVRQLQNSPQVTTSLATGPQQSRPWSGTNPALALDQAKPVYAGPLGDFLVTPRQGADWPPCPKPYRPARNYKASELYSPLFGDLEGLYECADGKSLNMGTVYVGRARIGKAYFVGPAKVPFEAPRDRLVLLTVGGKPAIAKLPDPGIPWNLSLIVIERFPSKNRPGIMVVVDHFDNNLKAAAALAAQIMGVRP